MHLPLLQEEDEGEEGEEEEEDHLGLSILPPSLHSANPNLFPVSIQLSSLPSSLSYNTLSIPFASHSSSPPNRQARTITIPRRSLFDVVAQLKAEADIRPGPAPGPAAFQSDVADKARGDGYDYETLISTLQDGDDLRSRVYEGGFKTWECGVDLAAYLASCLCLDGKPGGGGVADEGLANWLREAGIWNGNGGLEDDDEDDEGGGLNRGDDDDSGLDIIELGAGSAIPSLILLNHVLTARRRRRGRTRGGSDAHVEQRDKTRLGNIRFILCDYNLEVLRLVTGANVLLQLKGLKQRREVQSDPTNHDGGGDLDAREGDAMAQDANASANANVDGEGEVELDSGLHGTELSSLTNAGISIDLISGAWGDAFVDLVLALPPPTPIPTTPPRHPSNRPTLILSSETLYSPASLHAFVSTLLSLLRRSHHSSRESMALVAAKKMYFGVGGGVDEFIGEVGRRGGAVVEVVREIDEARGGGGGGVGRVVLKVSLSHSHNPMP